MFLGEIVTSGSIILIDRRTHPTRMILELENMHQDQTFDRCFAHDIRASGMGLGFSLFVFGPI